MAGVAVAVLLGAINRWVAMPGLLQYLHSVSTASIRSQRRFASVLQIESVVLITVLFAAALLTNSVSSSTPPAPL